MGVQKRETTAVFGFPLNLWCPDCGRPLRGWISEIRATEAVVLVFCQDAEFVRSVVFPFIGGEPLTVMAKEAARGELLKDLRIAAAAARQGR